METKLGGNKSAVNVTSLHPIKTFNNIVISTMQLIYSNCFYLSLVTEFRPILLGIDKIHRLLPSLSSAENK